MALAATGAAQAYLAPGVVAGDMPGAFGTWTRWCAIACLCVSLLIAVANLLPPTGQGPSRALSAGALALGVLLLVAIAMGGLYFVLDEVPAQDAFGLGVIVAMSAAGAIVLAQMTRTASP